MTTAKTLNLASPVLGASIGAAVAGCGLLITHMVFFAAMPVVILTWRALEASGFEMPALQFESSLVLLAVLSPVVFACYGAAVAAPDRWRTRVIVATAIVAINVSASTLLYF